MKIRSIKIENYKSIKKLKFNPNAKLNAFIGENSVGKSNIFNAINWITGPVFPSFNSTLPVDHWQGDEDNKIKIRLEYNDGNYLELAEEWEYNNGYRSETKSGLNFCGGYIKSEQRELYCNAYLDVDRQIKDYLPSNRWTLIGRILQQINYEFNNETTPEGEFKSEVFKKRLINIRDEVLFSVGRTSLESKDGLMDKFLSIIQRESASQLNRKESEFQIDLSLYDPWNFYRTLQLLVDETDTDMPPLQASALGMGIQASITIAVLKAYAELKIQNKTPIFIDEPELFLHPQAQRNFYNELIKMSEDKKDEETGEEIEGLQIFYCTHSPNFLRADRFNEIFLVRKDKNKGTYLNFAKPEEFIEDLENRKGVKSSSEEFFLYSRNAYENTGDSQKANEAFFARKIILVEGQTECFILPYFFKLASFDYVKEGISIVRCGTKGELDRFFRLYNEFGIPTYVIFDGDKHHEGTEEEESTKNKNIDITSLFGEPQEWTDGTVTNRYLGFETFIEENLGYKANKKDNVVKLFIEVKERIKTCDDLPRWVTEVITKIKSLESPLSSVLQLTSRENNTGSTN